MRLLTKSRFKLGLECPNKLFFTRKEKEYANQKQSDPFLLALADGGFQVEELARLHYPEGILIEDKKSDTTYDYDLKVAKTAALLERDEVVIFEAAFQFENLFIRIDILKKTGNTIELIEVKAKSFDSGNCDYEFVGKRGHLATPWKLYLFDVAFQSYVILKAFPEFKVQSFLMLADKSKTTTIAGLNQQFRISKSSDNRTGVESLLTYLEDPNTQSVLSRYEVSDLVAGIHSGRHRVIEDYDFETAVTTFAEAYVNDTYLKHPVSFSACKQCEFKNAASDPTVLKSGFEYCFKTQKGWNSTHFEAPKTFEVWDFRKGAKLFNDENKVFLSDLSMEDIDIKPEAGKYSRTERQWLQIEKAVQGDLTEAVLKDDLKAEMAKWHWPLNFIDFETSTVALPFFEGMHPYEQVAFQFSHHVVYEDGRIEHANEYLNTAAGVFPNFEFIRALKRALSENNGSIFRYAAHENSILNAIYWQLQASEEPDKEPLMYFIKQVSQSKNSSTIYWEGPRNMIDLCKVIKDFYYNPYTKGSNSIKAVLPAVFKSSALIKAKYSQPLSAIGVSSKNFDADKVWLTESDGEVVDPYKTLGPLFADWDNATTLLSDFQSDEGISDGGAALTAYGKLQYTDMSAAERAAINNALLKYCELDTLAMVMIYEHLQEMTELTLHD